MFVSGDDRLTGGSASCASTTFAILNGEKWALVARVPEDHASQATAISIITRPMAPSSSIGMR